MSLTDWAPTDWATPAGKKKSTLASVLGQAGDIVDSPLGKLATGAVGTYLNAQDTKADRAQDAATSEADRLSRERMAAAGQLNDLNLGELNDDRTRAQGVLAANPLGADQQYAARESFLRNAAGLLSNSNITPTDPAVAAAMPQMTGGFQITPEFIQAMQQAHAPEGVAASIAQRQMDSARLDPRRGDAGTLGALGLGDTSALQSKVGGFQQDALSQQDAEAKQRREALSRALDNNPTGKEAAKAAPPKGYEYDKKTGQLKKKGGGFWHTLGKIASVAAPIVAAPFTGGASLALIGAGAGAANGLLNGGGLKGALLGGAMGGVTAGLGGGAANGTGVAMSAGKSALKQAISPKMLANVAGAALSSR